MEFELRAGVPARVAVPLPLLVKVTPLGNAPVSLRVGVGGSVAFTVKELELPVTKVMAAALVIVGAVPVTVIETVAAALVLLPLFAANWKESVPT